MLKGKWKRKGRTNYKSEKQLHEKEKEEIKHISVSFPFHSLSQKQLTQPPWYITEEQLKTWDLGLLLPCELVVS